MQHVHYEQQSDNLQKFHEQLASYSLKFPQRKQRSEESMIKSLEKSSDGLRQALQKFETQLMVYQEIGKSRGRTMNEVRYAFYDLTRSLGTAGHFSVYKLQAEHRAGLPAQIRSEIRSIKGLLLSRRMPLNNPFQQSTVT
ncbi:hypothetical protein K7432_017106 [Basidiobolus ranarum]|uniref:Uncharacterized protein n=1 Tax=Basidiobolus ranarum TaxID=34480 RepID=A0ABR2WDU1_9FUNG